MTYIHFYFIGCTPSQGHIRFDLFANLPSLLQSSFNFFFFFHFQTDTEVCDCSHTLSLFRCQVFGGERHLATKTNKQTNKPNGAASTHLSAISQSATTCLDQSERLVAPISPGHPLVLSQQCVCVCV